MPPDLAPASRDEGVDGLAHHGADARLGRGDAVVVDERDARTPARSISSDGLLVGNAGAGSDVGSRESTPAKQSR